MSAIEKLKDFKDFCDTSDKQQVKGGFITAKDEEYLIQTIKQAISEHEAQLKAKDEAFNLLAETVYMKAIREKDEEIERLKEDYEKRLDKWRSKIWNMPYYAETKTARSIVAMLFWEWKEAKRHLEQYNDFRDVRISLKSILER